MSISLSVLGFLGSALVCLVGVFCFKRAGRNRIERRGAIIFSLPVVLICFLPLVVRGEFFLSELPNSDAAVVLVSIIMITVSSIRLFYHSGDSAGVVSSIKSFMAGLLMVVLMFLLWVVMLNGLG